MKKLNDEINRIKRGIDQIADVDDIVNQIVSDDSIQELKGEVEAWTKSSKHGAVKTSRIHRQRKLLGMSQDDLALKIGVSRSLVTKWENGTRHISSEDLVTLCRGLTAQLIIC